MNLVRWSEREKVFGREREWEAEKRREEERERETERDTQTDRQRGRELWQNEASERAETWHAAKRRKRWSCAETTTIENKEKLSTVQITKLTMTHVSIDVKIESISTYATTSSFIALLAIRCCSGWSSDLDRKRWWLIRHCGGGWNSGKNGRQGRAVKEEHKQNRNPMDFSKLSYSQTQTTQKRGNWRRIREQAETCTKEDKESKTNKRWRGWRSTTKTKTRSSKR